MSTAPTVLALCVNWNGEDVLGRTVESLLACGYPNLELTVIDNASDRNPEPHLRRFDHRVRLLRLPKNRGYAGALNAVLGRPTLWPVPHPDYFLILNNDVTILPGCVEHLVRAARELGPGVFGPKILQESRPRRLEAAWGEFTWSHTLVRLVGKGAVDGPRWDEQRKVPVLLGSVLLIDRGVLEVVGLFDEGFFMYHEEVDFQYRLNRAGLAAWHCPAARVLHRGAHSTRDEPLKKTYWIRRNTVLFFRKHGASLFQWGYFLATLAASLALNLLTLRWSRSRTIVRGALDGLHCRLEEGRL